MAESTFPLGVVIVTHNSGDVIGPCLDSLLAVLSPGLRVVVVDNTSADDTAELVEARTGHRGPHVLDLIRAPRNGGFAAGVNLGLARLAEDPGTSWFWVLNPDCTVPVGTPAVLLSALRDAAPFALMGGRTLYADPPFAIQSDGGRVGRWTGVCRLVNRGADPGRAAPPDARRLEFISGANMVASRDFLRRAGPMPEDYFLYYEEVAWAARRGDLPLRVCPAAVVHHRAGTAIGSAGPGRRASAFANYFNYRGRMRFLRRHRPWALPTALVFALLKCGHIAATGGAEEAAGALRGSLGLPPPRKVRERLRRIAPEFASRSTFAATA